MVDSLQKVCIHGSSSVSSHQTSGTKERLAFQRAGGPQNKTDVLEMVKDLEVVFGKGPGSQPVPSNNGLAPMWKKKFIF